MSRELEVQYIDMFDRTEDRFDERTFAFNMTDDPQNKREQLEIMRSIMLQCDDLASMASVYSSREEFVKMQGRVMYMAGTVARSSKEIKEMVASSAEDAPTLTPEAQILEDARATINGARQDQYGNAEDSFDTIASFWSTYLTGVAKRVVTGFDPDADYDLTVIVSNYDVANLQALFKMGREMYTPKRDNRLDGIGYIALGERCHVKNEERANPKPF